LPTLVSISSFSFSDVASRFTSIFFFDSSICFWCFAITFSAKGFILYPLPFWTPNTNNPSKSFDLIADNIELEELEKIEELNNLQDELEEYINDQNIEEEIKPIKKVNKAKKWSNRIRITVECKS